MNRMSKIASGRIGRIIIEEYTVEFNLLTISIL